MAEWEKNPDTENAYRMKVFQAVQNKDSTLLFKLAKKYKEHHYVYVPQFVTYDKANEIARSFGGHLLCIDSKDEENFVLQKATKFIGVWLGLTSNDECRMTNDE